jgi:hypothetical protein
VPVVQVDALGQVGERVVRGRLVGDDVHLDTPAEQFGQDGRAVADQADRPADPVLLGHLAAGDRVVQVVGDLVQVAVVDPPAQPRLVDVDDQADTVVERDGQRLGAAHATAASGHGERPGQGAVEPLGRDSGERLIGALQDPLGADVDPRPGRHLAVHRQAQRLEPAELRPVGPVGDEVGVRDQHPRSPLVRPHDADRPTGLDEHRLVLLERGQRAHHGVEAGPVARRLARPAVHDQVLGSLGHLGVEVVLQHPQRGLGLPAARGQRRTPRGGDDSASGGAHDR